MKFMPCVILCALVSLLPNAFAQEHDARVWVPSDDQIFPNAVHADRGIDVQGFYAKDPNAANPEAFGTELGVHYRVLSIGNGWMIETHVGLSATVAGNRNADGSMMAGYGLQGGGEVARLYCPNKRACLFVGGQLGVDYNNISGDTKPGIYISNPALQGDGETGVLFSKNNKSLILKLIGGVSGDAQKDHYGNYNQDPKNDGTGFEFYGEVGAGAQLLLGNKLWIMASVVERLGLINGANKQTEGKLHINARLWGVPIDEKNPSFFKGIYWEFEAKYIDGTIVGPDSGYYGVPPSNQKLQSFVAKTGLVVEY